MYRLQNRTFFPSMAQTRLLRDTISHSHLLYEFFSISTKKAPNETISAKETILANEKLKDSVKDSINKATFAKETINDTTLAKETP